MKRTTNPKTPRKQTRNRSRRESGQIVIFMAFLLVFLVGMAGLAIDGGRLYFEYRDVQNATDAAIQAATYAKCTNRDIIPAAFDAVEDNGIDIDDGVTVWVFNPPITGDKEGDDDYIEVVVNSTIDPYFIQVVYDADLTVSARAVGICIPDQTAGYFKGALYAHAPASCNNALSFSGATSNVVGGMHSNGDLHIGGGGQDITITGDVSVVTPGVTWNPSKINFTDGPPLTGVDPMPFPEFFDIEDYRPDPIGVFDDDAYHPYDPPLSVRTGFGLHARQAHSQGEYHVYQCARDNDKMDRNWLESLGLVVGGVMEPGLYYSACDIDLSGIDEMIGVTLVAERQIKVSGAINMITPYPGTPALAMFSNEDDGTPCNNNQSINFSGSSTEWHGILYAPTGVISASGSDNRGYGAMIGYGVGFSGSTNYIEWDETLLPPNPPQIGVAE